MPIQRNFLGKITGKGLSKLWHEGERAQLFYNLAKKRKYTSPHRFNRAENKLLLKEREYLKAKRETTGARILTGIVGGSAVGTGVGTYTYNKTKEKKPKEINYYKFASVLSTLTGSGIRKAKKLRNYSSELIRTTSEGSKMHEFGNRLYNKANNKLLKERAKSYSSWGLTGYTSKKLTDLTKEGNLKFFLGTTGVSTLAGTVATIASPELPNNAKNIGEGALIGAGFGAGVGLITPIAFKNKKIVDQLRKKYMNKKGNLSYHKIEKDLNKNFSKSEEKKINRMIGQERSKSFVLKNRYLTGIPTLGIAPAVAEAKVKEKVIRNLARD